MRPALADRRSRRLQAPARRPGRESAARRPASEGQPPLPLAWDRRPLATLRAPARCSMGLVRRRRTGHLGCRCWGRRGTLRVTATAIPLAAGSGSRAWAQRALEAQLVERWERLVVARHPEVHPVPPSLVQVGHLQLVPQQAPAAAAPPEQRLVQPSGERPGHLQLVRQQVPGPLLEGCRRPAQSDPQATAARSRLTLLLSPIGLSPGHLARRPEPSARPVFHPDPLQVH
jgi:hypothetical protein